MIRRLGVVSLAIAVGFGTAAASVGAASPRAAAEPPFLEAISCTGPTFCVAVGRDSSFQPFAVRFDGKVWRTSATPPAGRGLLSSVSCTSPTFCFAAGFRGTVTSPTTLIERWDGKAWRVVSHVRRNGSSELRGISCVSSKFCVAVGSRTTKGGEVMLLEHWDGQSWRIVPSPRITGSDYSENDLLGISCTSTTQCYATGSIVWSSTRKTLIVRWDGRAWSLAARQRKAPGQNVLEGVSCTSANACMAVGASQSDPPTVLLHDRWNGTSWQMDAGREQPFVDMDFKGVACASSASCLAVGSRNYDHPYAEVWNGSRWTQTKTPGASATWGLYGVDCIKPGLCYAVGGNVVQRWNAGTWKTVATV